MKKKVIVVGAGAIGMSIAYELTTRGAEVTVVERDPVFQSRKSSVRRSASAWAASGILPPANFDSATDPIDQLRGLSHRLFPKWASQLIDQTGIDCELERCGGWYLADTPGEIASMMGMVHYWQDLAIDCEPRSLEQLAAVQPSLKHWTERAANAKAWWVPDEYQIRTTRYLNALASACEANGATLIDDAKVVDVVEHHQAGTVNVVATRSGETVSWEGDQVVVCGGSWTGLVSPRLKLAQSIIPVRGQILLLNGGKRDLSSVVNFGNRYLVPRKDGLVLVGSCEEEVGLQHGTTPAVLHDLRKFVADICPALSHAVQVTAWSGLRPMTFDGFPMFGKLPDSQSIYVAAGHYRSGIHLSPGTAVCLADLMFDQQPPLEVQPFSVGKQQQHI
ncbi:FAD-binding oxidoreductase [Stieleria sp. JC731]|uniref:NAD(P)/FAD-dependent oxidoreductase n=1 Tax=Pirellulaceae TaxID=2691357 RepID=UPI001E506938|nr:FAD-dependent oxidoreductase [Stieleria sp. JC731]MCC9599825.1 FAD-binding oxidoreductase [Stieleria sp. JC731]